MIVKMKHFQNIWQTFTQKGSFRDSYEWVPSRANLQKRFTALLSIYIDTYFHLLIFTFYRLQKSNFKPTFWFAGLILNHWGAFLLFFFFLKKISKYFLCKRDHHLRHIYVSANSTGGSSDLPPLVLTSILCKKYLL